MQPKKILIIKHGALGDIIKALPIIQRIMHNHVCSHITLLTTQPYWKFLQNATAINKFIIDKRSRNPFVTFALLKQIYSHHFDLIIDLQNSRRTNRYFYFLKRIFKTTAQWSGTAIGCDYFLPFHLKQTLHVQDRFKQQFAHIQPLLFSNVNSPADHLHQLSTNLNPEPMLKNWPQYPLTWKQPYVLMIPGCSARSPEKRWPITYYIDIAQRLKKQSIGCVFIGGTAETSLSAIVKQQCSESINLINQIKIENTVSLAQQSLAIIGNDTGPTYLAQLSGQPTIMPWSNHSNPQLHAPRGDHVHILQAHLLNDLSPDIVWQHIQTILQTSTQQCLQKDSVAHGGKSND